MCESAYTEYVRVPIGMLWNVANICAQADSKHKVSCSGFLHNTSPMQHSCSHSNAICNHSFKKRKELRTQEQHGATTRCRTQSRNQSRPERPQPQPPHTRGTFHRRLQPLYTEKYKVSCCGFLPNTSPIQQSCSHSNAICNYNFKKRKELRTQEQHGTTTRCRTQRRNQSRPERPQPQPPHTRGTFHRRLQPLYMKNTRFRAVASSPTQAPCNIHAAIPMRSATTASRNAKNYAHRINMEQPLVAEHRGGTNRVRNDRSRNRPTHEVPFIAGCSHFTRKNKRFRAAASSPTQAPCNIHAAIPMRSATTASRNAKNYAHRNNMEQPLVAEHRGGTNRVRNNRSRNRRTHEVPFIAGCSQFTRKNKRFRAPASSPKQSPCNIHAAIPLRSATTASRNAKNYAHRNNMEQPLVAERRGGTNRVRNDRSRNRRTHEVPFIAGCSHFTRKNTRFRAAASSPTHPPCNINATFPSYHFPSSPPFIKVSFFL